MGGKNTMTFWDFCAPIYDFFEKCNGTAYARMLKAAAALTPDGATVFEAACGTAEIGIAVSKKAESVLCTDVSPNMLKIAAKKIAKKGINNIKTDYRSIYETNEPDASFDVVIAAQILHLIDEPERAAAELRRIAKGIIIIPLALTKELSPFSKFLISLYKIVGFAPKRSFTRDEYKHFIRKLGFKNVKFITIDGSMPIVIAISSVR
jgi:ubiquinone/menaquinone biosynthesis C-methylase UbiE